MTEIKFKEEIDRRKHSFSLNETELKYSIHAKENWLMCNKSAF